MWDRDHHFCGAIQLGCPKMQNCTKETQEERDPETPKGFSGYQERVARKRTAAQGSGAKDMGAVISGAETLLLRHVLHVLAGAEVADGSGGDGQLADQKKRKQ